MSNTEKEKNRPLDMEEFNESQIEEVTGGKEASDSGKKSGRRRSTVNTAYFNISNRD